MFTLEDLYNRLSYGTAGAKRSGAFIGPVAMPDSTMRTLNDIMAKAPALDGSAATAAEVVAGKTYWGLGSGSNWGVRTGTMANVGTQNITPGATPQTITQGYHDGSGTVAGDANLVTGNIRSGANIFGVNGDANVVNTGSGDATTSHILSGKKAWVDGFEVTGIMTNVGAQNITPGATPQTITQGYHSGTGEVAGDANLVTGNIRSGANIFGVSGDANVVDTSTGDAAAGDMLTGKKAWVDGVEVTGTMANVGAQNITPGATSQTITQGYHDGSGTVAGDADLTAENIKSGVTVFGVTGTFTTAIAKRVNKTGQTECWDAAGASILCTGTGQDGEYEYGLDPAVAPTEGATGGYNSPVFTGTRFIDNNNGTVTDTLTALIWQKDSSCHGVQTWQGALNACKNLSAATSGCGLTDGSSAGQWRLPNVNELHSLGPAWPLAAPFVGGLDQTYWSSTTYANYTDLAWGVYFKYGSVNYDYKSSSYYVRAVRGGQ